MGGFIDKLKGKTKEVAGAVTGDKGTENEGKIDQAKGSVKNAGENLKERGKDVLGRSADKAKDVAERVERGTKPHPKHGD